MLQTMIDAKNPSLKVEQKILNDHTITLLTVLRKRITASQSPSYNAVQTVRCANE